MIKICQDCKESYETIDYLNYNHQCKQCLEKQLVIERLKQMPSNFRLSIG